MNFSISQSICVRFRLNNIVHTIKNFLLRFLIFDLGVDFKRRVDIGMSYPLLDPLNIVSLMNKDGNARFTKTVKRDALRKLRMSLDQLTKRFRRVVRIIQRAILMLEDIIIVMICAAKQVPVLCLFGFQMLKHLNLLLRKRICPRTCRSLCGINTIHGHSFRHGVVYTEFFCVKINTGPAEAKNIYESLGKPAFLSLLRDQMGEAGMKWGVCQNKNVSMEPEGKNYRMLSCKLDDNVKFIHDD